MLALTFSTVSGSVTLERERPLPVPGAGEVLIKVVRSGICSTDLEICRGYVPGYAGVLGHEFVGVVAAYGPSLQQPHSATPPASGESASTGEQSQNGVLSGTQHAARSTNGQQDQHRCGGPSSADVHGRLPLGTRVVGEINCNDAHFTCADAIFQRNHAPGRSVLGIINRDGCLAQFLTLPAANLHVVPEGLTDAEAVFAEPLAAACRIPEQGLPRRPEADRVAVIGDGKLGLLVAQVLSRHVAAAGGPRVTLIGRHVDKMGLVQGEMDRVVSDGNGSTVAERFAGQFDLVVEASGSATGIRTALALCRPLGTILLKSTVSTLQQPAPPPQPPTADGQDDPVAAAAAGKAAGGASAPTWAEIANDVVVNEKILVGSRCGPFDAALDLMARDEGVRQLLRSMVSAELPLEQGQEALRCAASKGVLKVQLVMPA